MGASELEIWLINLALLLILTKISEFFMKRLALPNVLGYIIIGMFLSHLGFKFDPVCRALATLGIIVMLFNAGLSESFRLFMREFRSAGLIAIGGVVASLISGYIVGLILNFGPKETLALGVAYSATSVSLTLRTLEDLGKLGSEEARIIVGAAVIDDVLGLALLGAALGILIGTFDIVTIAGTASLAFAFWLAVAISFERLSKYILKVESRLGISEGTLVITFAILLLLSYVAAYMRLSAILLAYALGLGMSGNLFISRKVSTKIRSLVVLFTPLFFIYAGSLLKVKELTQLVFASTPIPILIVTTFGFISKLCGCYIPARLLGLSHRKSLVVGVGMIPRAEVMLVAAAAALELGAMSQTTYLGLLLLVVLSSVTVPITLKFIYKGMTS